MGTRTSDWQQMNKIIAAEWRSLSEEEKAPFRAKASRTQKSRAELVKTPLNEAEAEPEAAGGEELSVNQKNRLNQARLDGALAQVAQHPAWGHGFALSDHIAALRANLIEMDMDPAKLDEGVRQYFGYDSKILLNPQLPQFDRACMMSYGGVCSCDPNIKFINKLVEQLDEIFAVNDILATRVLLKLTLNVRRWERVHSGEKELLQPPAHLRKPMWFVLCCVARKPKSHVMISLRAGSAIRFPFRLLLGFENVQGGPCVETSHLLFAKLLRVHLKHGQPLCHFGLKVSCLSEVGHGRAAFGQNQIFPSQITSWRLNSSLVLIQYIKHSQVEVHKTYSCSVEENATDMDMDSDSSLQFVLSTSCPEVSSQVGQGFVSEKETKHRGSIATSRLRFGMSELIAPPLGKKIKAASSGEQKPPQPKQNHRSVHQLFVDPNDAGGVEGATSSSSSSKIAGEPLIPQQMPEESQLADPDQPDQDLYPLHLAPAAMKEAAKAAEVACGALLEEENPDNDKVDEQGKKRSRTTGGAKFQQTVGIQRVGAAQRHGMKCYHCGASISKGDMRFEFAFSVSKPARSIHTTCVVQMNSDERDQSLICLDNLICSGLGQEELSACQEALSVLRGIDMAGA